MSRQWAECKGIGDQACTLGVPAGTPAVYGTYGGLFRCDNLEHSWHPGTPLIWYARPSACPPHQCEQLHGAEREAAALPPGSGWSSETAEQLALEARWLAQQGR